MTHKKRFLWAAVIAYFAIATVGRCSQETRASCPQEQSNG